MVNIPCLNITKSDAINMTADIVKSITQIIVLNILTTFIDGEDVLFGEKMLRNMLYITIARVVYNLVTKKIFVPKRK